MRSVLTESLFQVLFCSLLRWNRNTDLARKNAFDILGINGGYYVEVRLPASNAAVGITGFRTFLGIQLRIGTTWFRASIDEITRHLRRALIPLQRNRL